MKNNFTMISISNMVIFDQENKKYIFIYTFINFRTKQHFLCYDIYRKKPRAAYMPFQGMVRSTTFRATNSQMHIFIVSSSIY